MPCFWQNAPRGAFLLSRNLFTFGSLSSLLRALSGVVPASELILSEIRRLWKLAQSGGRSGQRGPEGNCPAFKPPFDIIHRIAQKAKQAASDLPTACPVLLPRPLVQ